MNRPNDTSLSLKNTKLANNVINLSGCFAAIDMLKDTQQSNS